MSELLESLVSVTTKKVLSNNCYIDAKEYFWETVIKFFMNKNERFTSYEYKLIMSEFMLQVQHDKVAAGREWDIQFFDTSAVKEINEYVIECRELAPDLVARLTELNNFAGKFKDFEDEISIASRTREFILNITQLVPPETPGGPPSRNHRRNVGALRSWADHRARLMIYGPDVTEDTRWEQWDYLLRLRAFTDYQTRLAQPRAPTP